MSTATAKKTKKEERFEQVKKLGLLTYIRKEEYQLDEKSWNILIEANIQEKEEAERNKSSYEIMSDAGAIKMQIEKVLIEDPDDAEELLEQLFNALAGCKMDASEKLASMVWVKDKISEHVESAKAVKKYYDAEKKKFYKTEKSRSNDLYRLKDRVVTILENVFDGKTKVNGKSISVVEVISGSITDEDKAFEVLKEKNLAWVVYRVDGQRVKDLKTRMAKTIELFQDEKGEPQPVDLVDLQTKIMDLQADLARVEPTYDFAPGKDINSFVKERVEARREAKNKLLAVHFGGVDPEDMEAPEREEFDALLKTEYEGLSLEGIEVHITKYPRGF